MFHGSRHKLTMVEPKPTGVLNGEPRVFATPDIRAALVFIPRWDDLGTLGRHSYLMECRPKAFDLLKVDGHIHKLPPANFMRDDRLGPDEYVSKYPEPVLEVTYVKDVFRALKKTTDIILVTYAERRSMLRKFLAEKAT
jgi:hypothetical protein